MTKYHRFDAEAAYRDTFKGVVWRDDRPYMDGPRGLIPVTLSAVNRHYRQRDDAHNQGYHDLDTVLEHIREEAYWEAVKVVDGLRVNGYGSLIPHVSEIHSESFDNDDTLPPPPEELPLVL